MALPSTYQVAGPETLCIPVSALPLVSHIQSGIKIYEFKVFIHFCPHQTLCWPHPLFLLKPAYAIPHSHCSRAGHPKRQVWPSLIYLNLSKAPWAFRIKFKFFSMEYKALSDMAFLSFSILIPYLSFLSPYVQWEWTTHNSWDTSWFRGLPVYSYPASLARNPPLWVLLPDSLRG